MDVTYTSEKYDPNKSYARYVRKMTIALIIVLIAGTIQWLAYLVK